MAITAQPEMLRAGIHTSDRAIGVDRKANIVKGYVVAELGRFKSEGRGQFNSDSLDRIVSLANEEPRGLRSRFQHPNASDDGLGKFLGRSRNFRRDGDRVRGDLYLNQTALETPPKGGKPYGHYVMDLAASDPGALSSSLVLVADKIPQADDEPELWLPTRILASDIVDDGDAVHGSLLGSAFPLAINGRNDVPPEIAERAYAYLDRAFPNASRDVIEGRFNGYINRYLSKRFGAEKPTGQDAEALQAIKSLGLRVAKLHAETARLTESFRQLQTLKRSQTGPHKLATIIAQLCNLAGEPGRAGRYISDRKTEREVMQDLEAITRAKRAKRSR